MKKNLVAISLLSLALLMMIFGASCTSNPPPPEPEEPTGKIQVVLQEGNNWLKAQTFDITESLTEFSFTYTDATNAHVADLFFNFGGDLYNTAGISFYIDDVELNDGTTNLVKNGNFEAALNSDGEVWNCWGGTGTLTLERVTGITGFTGYCLHFSDTDYTSSNTYSIQVTKQTADYSANIQYNLVAEKTYTFKFKACVAQAE